MQHCGGGTLHELIRSRSQLSETLARHYCAEILLGITHLHELDIIHRDLKPENVFLDNFDHAMIGDFGCSRSDAGELSATFCGSNGYVAPEVLGGQGYTQDIDIYCLGVTLYEMIMGQLPFYHMNPEVLNRLILKGVLNIPSRISEHVADFIRRTMCSDVRQRLGASNRNELFAHEFFVKMDFEALRRRELPCPEPLDHSASGVIHGASEKLKLEAFGRKSFGARVSQCLRRLRPLEGFDYNASFRLKSNLSTASTNASGTLSALTFRSSSVHGSPTLRPCAEYATDSCEL
jgi:serine/threonine protein kinase